MRITTLCLLLVLGCDTGSDSADANGMGGVGGAPQPEPPIGSICDVDRLIAQCPPGSLPIVEEALTAGCEGDAQIMNDSGAVTGVCRAAASCTFICNFSDPCRCGVDRITNEGVFCAECVTACGNARCEGGEDPQSCPIDCAERCPPDAERCNGNHREVCEDNGLWTPLTCREDQRCIVAADLVVQALTLCETRVSQGGGVFNGMGRWHPVRVDDYTPARFAVGNLAFGVMPLVFLDDGRLLALDGSRLVHLDLTDPITPVSTPLPTEFFGASRPGVLTSSTDTSRLAQRFVVSQARLAGGDLFGQVWDIESGGLRNLADFGGYPTGFEDLANIQRGPWAMSADGRRVAFAVGVPFDGVLRASVIVWNADTGGVYRVLGFDEPQAGVSAETVPNGLHFSADGTALVASYPNESGSLMVVWDVAERRYARLFQSAIPDARLTASRAGDDRVVLFNGRDGEVWDLTAEDRVLAFTQAGAVMGFTPDGEAVFVDAVQLNLDGSPARDLPGAAPVFDPMQARMIAEGVIYGEL